jgi:hypothetical protein
MLLSLYCEPLAACSPPPSLESVTVEVQTQEHDGILSEYTYHGQCKYVGKGDSILTNIASGYLNAVINIWFVPMGVCVCVCVCLRASSTFTYDVQFRSHFPIFTNSVANMCLLTCKGGAGVVQSV